MFQVRNNLDDVDTGLEIFWQSMRISFQMPLDFDCKVHMVGSDFSATFDNVDHENLIFKVRK